ncbi:hypothetical protein EJB05_01638 [Eragrostis curvula]|uniref:Uncharacterized protein n=1 Tax=Eragrostis curvula TaxID=38414 RepID=A0A5J9WNH6_9POAL|nr:hypothetical protein EJB05_01638 [Eragrostis curvula]
MGRIEALQRLMETFWFWRSPRRLSMPSVHLAKPSSLVVVAFWLERSPLFWSVMPDEGVLAQVPCSLVARSPPSPAMPGEGVE